MVVLLLMNSRIVIPFLAIMYVAAGALTYATYRRYPDHSGVAATQWLLFYVVTVIYPIIWTVQELRLLRKLELEHSKALRRYAWAPVIVGGTSLLIGLSLLSALLR
jgi:hypothetical protein